MMMVMVMTKITLHHTSSHFVLFPDFTQKCDILNCECLIKPIHDSTNKILIISQGFPGRKGWLELSSVSYQMHQTYFVEFVYAEINSWCIQGWIVLYLKKRLPAIHKWHRMVYKMYNTNQIAGSRIDVNIYACMLKRNYYMIKHQTQN